MSDTLSPALLRKMIDEGMEIHNTLIEDPSDLKYTMKASVFESLRRGYLKNLNQYKLSGMATIHHVSSQSMMDTMADLRICLTERGYVLAEDVEEEEEAFPIYETE